MTAWLEATVGTLEPAVAAWLTAVYTAAKNKLLTVGGTVKLVLLAAGNTAPTDTLIDEVQTAVDPTENAGEGLGLAPIGHVVRVTGVTPEPVNLTLNLTYAQGWSWDAVQSYVADAVDTYFAELAGQWSGSDFLTVRISQIESRILSTCSTMVTDIGGTQINGKEENLVLDPDSIPVRGSMSRSSLMTAWAILSAVRWAFIVRTACSSLSAIPRTQKRWPFPPAWTDGSQWSCTL